MGEKTPNNSTDIKMKKGTLKKYVNSLISVLLLL